MILLCDHLFLIFYINFRICFCFYKHNKLVFVSIFLAVVNNCGAMLNASTTQNWIYFQDSDSDGLYDNSVNCSWTIQAPEDKTIEIHVTIKFIECNYDHLKVSLTSI